MSAVKTDQSEGIPGAGIPEQAVKKMLTGSAVLSLPAPSLFFALFFSIHAFPTISEPGTGYIFPGVRLLSLAVLHTAIKLI